MDIFVLKALVDDLQQHLLGATVSKVFQMSSDDLLLRLWRGRDQRLLLSTHATLQRLQLTTERFENPQRPPRFAAFLRAHLQQVRLRDITMQPYDRVVRLTWERAGEVAPTLTLIHELTGPLANIILVDATGTILDALKHIPPDAKHRRPVIPGGFYEPLPLPPPRQLVSTLTLEHLQQLAQQGDWDTPHLQRLLLGLSRPLVAELLHRSQGDPMVCWELVQQLRQQYEDKTLSVSVCTAPDGGRHLSVLPLTYCDATCEPFSSAQDAVAAFYEPMMHTTLAESMRRDVQKTLRQRQQRLRKKIVNLQRDHQKLQDALPYQHYGTLLVAQRLPRGADRATVVDYYQPDQPTITIPLDPRLSVRDNAQVYFKKYRKAKSGLEKVQALLAQCAAEDQELDAFAQRVEQAEDWHTLHMFAEMLPGGQRPDKRRRARQPATPAQPYRTLVSSDGYTLYCGKSNQGNDVLLRQVAAPNDIWMHAHQQAGAHVVLKVQPGQDVPPRTLREAAALAAFYSRGKSAATVEVIYTQVKHVHKFRGARPGQVQVKDYQTLRVAPQLPKA